MKKKIIPKKFRIKQNSSYVHISKKYRENGIDAFYTSDISLLNTGQFTIKSDPTENGLNFSKY